MEFLKGIRIYNYRSIDSEGVELDDFGKVNVFIGKNNCGKSNILRFIATLEDFATNEPFSSDFRNWVKDSKNYFNLNSNLTIRFALQFNSTFYQKILKEKTGLNDRYGKILNLITNEKGSFLFNYTIAKPGASEVNVDFEKFYNKYPSLKTEYSMKNFENAINDYNVIQNTDFFLVENFRKINNNSNFKSFFKVDAKSKLYNGDNLVEQIQRIKSPSGGDDYHLEDKFNLFQNFLREILNNDDLRIDITTTNLKPDIIIKSNKNSNSRRHIDNVGTGIHQLIILAFSAIYNENSIFCIEEPEIFIHPEVQRKFIRYLIENTNNQYFITTHSNSFINEDGLNIYRVWHDGNSTKVEKAIDSKSKNQILDDLGYQASDLLQTNFIIWVEGPSDRIYIKHWIHCLDKKLIEGIHYTIMFYGGRLLSHLTIDDEEIEDFININKINRNGAIFLDSDKANADDSVNQTKQRIIDEFKTQNKFVLLTTGREIENYIDADTLNKALENMGKMSLNNYDLYTDIFDGNTINKIKLAKTVTGLSDDIFDVGNLKEDIVALTNAINKANNLIAEMGVKM